ncbi:MAG: HDOD domain-containing protein [Ignavibacteria bacterium]|nr:HDOD domain-containing protein [Ignavibacteria bacterium]
MPMTHINNIEKFNIKKIDEVAELPTLPNVANEIMNMIDKPYVSAAKLAKLISQDQGMVAKILSLANSPVYGLTQKVSTIELAIVVLGFDTIKELIISLSILNSAQSRNERYFNTNYFGKHSILCGTVARMLANDFGYRVSGEAFIAGLLHDIGISTMQKYLTSEFNLISELRFYQKISQLDAEKIIIGKTHPEIGSHLASKWNFPAQLIESIRFHHSPSEAVLNPTLTALIHLADHISSLVSEPYLLVEESEKLDDSIIETLELPDETYLQGLIRSTIELINSNFKELASMQVN